MIQPSLVQATSVNSMSIIPIIVTTKVGGPIVPIHTEQKDI